MFSTRWIGAGALALALAGCTPQGPVWASMDDDDRVLLALCEDFESRSVSIRVQGDDEPSWLAEGKHDFASGETLQYGVAPDGFITTGNIRTVDPISTVVVSFKSSSGDDGSLRGVFDLTDLHDGVWTSEDGHSATEPCS